MQKQYLIKKIVLIAVSHYSLPPDSSVVLADKQHKPNGILSLATYLKEKKGYEVVCIDHLLEDPIDYIRKNCEDLLFVGFSVMSASYLLAKGMLEKVKELAPQTPCIIGGAHPSAACREVVEDGFDVAVIGEGEIICAEIADIFRDAQDVSQRSGALAKIQSIAFRNEANEIIINPRTSFIEDLNLLPIVDRSLLPSERYSKTAISVFTSRGCPGKCLFCQSGPNLFGRRIRQRSVRSVLTEIGALLDAGCTFITFMDDCLLFDEAWVCEFCEEIKARDLRFWWICETRANFVTESIIRKIIEAGCRGLNIGFESGSDNTLKFLRKGTNTATYKKCVGVLQKYGLKFHSYLIMGSPHETKEDLEDTVRFVQEARPTQVAVSRLTPIYGCELFTYLAERHLITDVRDQGFYQNRYPIKCDHLTCDDLDHYETEIYKSMYIPGNIPDELNGNVLILDNPIPETLSTSKRHRATLWVKNDTNFHWLIYQTPIVIPFDEIKNKTVRDAFYQQISGYEVALYLNWFDADHKLLRIDPVGTLVGNVPTGECGTFALEFTVPEGLKEISYSFALVVHEKKSTIPCRYSQGVECRTIKVIGNLISYKTESILGRILGRL